MKNIELTKLYQEQIQNFKLARENYAALQQVIYKEIPLGEFSIRLQHNPARLISTNAKIDQATLQSRKCFLCQTGMPPEQKGVLYRTHYHQFINPYPIFEPHFTVPSNEHLPQRIENRFGDLLDLTFDFPEYTSFYNGPGCGASAPDHFHFQMAPRHIMPLEEDVNHVHLRQTLVQKDFYHISILKNYLREVIILQASDAHILSELFTKTLEIIGRAIPYEEEPMINLLGWFDNCQWNICIFPRKLRRPWQFFAEGNEKILFSPGCVDMAGLLIAPRREDFERYSPDLLRDLFRQVTADEKAMNQIIHELKNQL